MNAKIIWDSFPYLVPELGLPKVTTLVSNNSSRMVERGQTVKFDLLYKWIRPYMVWNGVK